MPVWLSGDSTAFVKRNTNTGGSSPSTGSFAGWCNGNTGDFGSPFLGSNPSPAE